jgi:hypothetical protein
LRGHDRGLVVDVHGGMASEAAGLVEEEVLGKYFSNDLAFVDGVFGFGP